MLRGPIKLRVSRSIGPACGAGSNGIGLILRGFSLGVVARVPLRVLANRPMPIHVRNEVCPGWRVPLASLESMLVALKASRRRAGATGAGLRAGRNIIRGATGRAYDFEALPVADVRALDDAAAVYIYARNLSAASAHECGLDATVEHYALGYISETKDLGETAAGHERAQHFRGHDFDIVLFVRVDQAMIREEIAADLIALHRPVLNDLLGGNQRVERG